MGKDVTLGREPAGPVVLHLDREVAHDLLAALTQALEPHSFNLADKAKKNGKGKSLKGTGKGAGKGAK